MIRTNADGGITIGLFVECVAVENTATVPEKVNVVPEEKEAVKTATEKPKRAYNKTK